MIAAITTYPLTNQIALSIVVISGQRQRERDQGSPSYPANEQRPGELGVADELHQHQRASDQIRQLPEGLAELRALTPIQS